MSVWTILVVSHGLGSAVFAILTIWVLATGRRQGAALKVAGLFGVTAIWAFLGAMQLDVTPGYAHSFESIRTWAWLQYIASLLVTGKPESRGVSGVLYRFGLPVLCLIAFSNDALFFSTTQIPTDYNVLQMLERVVLSIVGILMVENLVRNTLPTRRWHIAPLAIAAALLFGYDLYVFAEALFARGVDPFLQAGRGIVLVLIAPLLFLAMARNQDWRIDVHVSRNVVFHTVTLTIGGLFLLAAGGIASLVGRVPGTWGPILRISFFCASLVVLTTALTAGSFRSRIMRFLTDNFFSTRYDYRVEWARFVDTLSASDDIDPINVRAIRAIAKVVDSTGGVLWMEGAAGVYRVAATLNASIDNALEEMASGSFVSAFQGGSAIQQFGTRVPEPSLPAWVGDARLWLAIPLVKGERITGFVGLQRPRAPLRLTWESLDMLKLLGRQVASYLDEERATRALAESAAFIEYNKRFAFVVHDIKNLASQLSMMVANIRKFGDIPEFRTDMVHTIENSVTRLNALLKRLRSDLGGDLAAEASDPVAVARSVLADLVADEVDIELDAPNRVGRARIGADALRSIFTHLLTNAVDATPAGGRVSLVIRDGENEITAEVRDNGRGMDKDFIRDELFSPFRSTKSRGHGIGAFQARELVRAAGGELLVTSTVDKGTTMRILLHKTSVGVSDKRGAAAVS